MIQFDNPYHFPMIQAKLLNCIGMMYSGSSQLEIHKWNNLDSLITYFQSFHRSKISLADNSNPGFQEMIRREWHSWAKEESIRRFGYCIWVIHFLIKPMSFADKAFSSLNACPSITLHHDLDFYSAFLGYNYLVLKPRGTLLRLKHGKSFWNRIQVSLFGKLIGYSLKAFSQS